MLNSLQRAYLKEKATQYLPVIIALLMAFVTWSNYAYHGWKGLLGAVALFIAVIAYCVHLLQDGDAMNKRLRERVFEETTRANRAELERDALQLQVDSLSRPPTAEDIRRAAEQLNRFESASSMHIGSASRMDIGPAMIGGKLSSTFVKVRKTPESGDTIDDQMRLAHDLANGPTVAELLPCVALAAQIKDASKGMS